jgi:hypothetical protein
VQPAQVSSLPQVHHRPPLCQSSFTVLVFIASAPTARLRTMYRVLLPYSIVFSFLLLIRLKKPIFKIFPKTSDKTPKLVKIHAVLRSRCGGTGIYIYPLRPRETAL